MEIESDSLVVVVIIQRSERDDTMFGSLVEDCYGLINSIEGCSIRHILHTANEVAHVIARNSRFNLNSFTWIEPPIIVDSFLGCFVFLTT